MRRISTVTALIALTAFLPTVRAHAQGGTLTGNMAPFSYLLGAPWNCTTNVPAMGGQPSRTDTGTATFEVVPNNVVHNHVAASTVSADAYFGYSDRIKSYWQASADSHGGHGFLTSNDGKVYTGASSVARLSMQESTTYAKAAANKVTVHDVFTGPTASATFDTVCTR